MTRISNHEFMEWLAYDRVSPLPDPYWCAALIAWAVMRSQGAKRARLEDFLPRRSGSGSRSRSRPRTGPQSPQSGLAMIRAVEAVVAATPRRRGPLALPKPAKPKPGPPQRKGKPTRGAD